MNKEETLKYVQALQLKYLGVVDMQIRMEISTRKDQNLTMVVSYCNYKIVDTKFCGKQIDTKNKSKLFIHKLYWNKNNDAELKQIEYEIEDLIKKYGKDTI